MADIWCNHPDLTPQVLSAFARATLLEDLPQNEHQLERWFPQVLNPNLSYEIDTGSTKEYTEEMNFRSFDAEPLPGRRYGIGRKSGKLPPLGENIDLTETEIMFLQRADVPDSVVQTIYDDVEARVRAFRNTMERKRAQEVATGAVTLNGRLSSLSADFGRKGNRTVALATSWATPSAAAMAQERAVLTTFRGEGYIPAFAMVTQEVVDKVAVLEDYLEASRDIRQPTSLDFGEINEIRIRKGLPPFILNDAVGKQVGASASKLMPTNALVYLPASAVGQTQVGRPVSAGEPNVEIQANLGGPVVYVSRTSVTPTWYEIVFDGIGLPILGAPDLTAKVQVIL